jgi:Leucine-rich repeat (LRR) protein
LIDVGDDDISRLPSHILGHIASFLEGHAVCPFRITSEAWLEAADGAITEFRVSCNEPRSVAVLDRLPALKTLTMRRMEGDAPIVAVLDHLPHPQSLRRLVLAGNRYLTSLEGLEKVSALEELDCSGCKRLTILTPLTSLKKLQRLSLEGNNLRSMGMASLAPMLKILSGLEQLDLRRNDLGAQGAAVLAPALMALTGLRKLDLASNSLRARGIATLAPALMVLTGLEELELSTGNLVRKVFLVNALERRLSATACWKRGVIIDPYML